MKQINPIDPNKKITYTANFSNPARLIQDSVAVYDVEDKKLVLLFSGKTAAGVYVLNKPKNTASACMETYCRSKGKHSKNYFNRTVTFRIATTQQRELLGNNIMLCFDDRYKRDDLKHKMVSEFNKR